MYAIQIPIYAFKCVKVLHVKLEVSDKRKESFKTYQKIKKIKQIIEISLLLYTTFMVAIYSFVYQYFVFIFVLFTKTKEKLHINRKYLRTVFLPALIKLV